MKKKMSVKQKKLITQKVYQYSKTRTTYNRIQRKAWRKEQRKTLRKLLGKKCVLCGSTKYLMRHEIFGKKHPKSRYAWMIKNFINFRPLCYACHTFLHRFIRTNSNLKVFNQLIRKMEKVRKQK